MKGQEADQFQFYTSEVRKLRSELLQERERYSALLSLNSDCLFEYDILNDMVIFSKNKVFSRLNGLVLNEFSKKIKQFDCICAEDREGFRHLLTSGKDGSLEFRYIREDGGGLWCDARGVMIYDEEDNIKFVTGCIRNIDEEKREREKRLEEGKRDPLTRLFNKAHTRQEIEVFLMGEGHGGTHSLLIIDIDSFKKINDHMGHLFGDTVLTSISDNLMHFFYETDVVGRIGGDEFLVFLKNTEDSFKLKKKAEQIFSAFVDTYTGENKSLKITCSMGMASYPENGRDFGELFQKADLALSHAKKEGGNRCILFDSSMRPEDFHGKAEVFECYSVKEEAKVRRASIDMDITGFAFDIMAKTSDVSSAMRLLLDQMGRRFDVSHVCIMERRAEDGSMKSTYLWNDKEGVSEEGGISVSRETLLQMETAAFDVKGRCIINDTEKLFRADAGFGEGLLRYGVKSILICAFYEEGVMKGWIGMEDSRKKRNWTKEEMESLYTIARIVSFYLSKLRVSEHIQEKLDNLTNYDSLTLLPTLQKFKTDARERLRNGADRSYAVIHLDIANFKYVNDTCGYENGDKILCDLAQFLQEQREDGELVARGYADNFIMLAVSDNLELLKERVLSFSQKFGRDYPMKGLNSRLILISGICGVKPGTSDVNTAIDNANTARKSCKKALTSACRIYDEKMEAKLRREAELTSCMETALENGEFIVYLQPKVVLRGSRLAGAEALVRWRRADGTILPPNEFIPLFERNGFIVALDNYVYEEVCRMLNKWLKAGTPVVTVSFNVSRSHLNDRNFVYRIKEVADRYEIPYHLLELEMTESMFLDNPQTAISIMKELRNMGFGVSIDDFGAGYSSLNLLKDMTTDVLKLDKEFFRQGDMQIEEQIIVSSIISMAKKLNMKVLSEGVETQMQSDFLKNVDCDMVQGYLYDKPMPIQEFEALLSNRDQVIEPKPV